MSVPRIGLSALFENRLPINRKERYYTGTVLPMIVASDEFKHFGRFLALCGVPALRDRPASSNVQFFTEYGFEESLKDGAEKRFSKPGGRYAPDVVVYIESEPSLLLGVEAKVFARPSKADIDKQLQEQKNLLRVMKDGVGTQPCIYQVALLPERLRMPEQIGEVPVLTWEKVANEFRDVASPYWIEVLDLACDRYDRLAGTSGSGRQNCDAVIAGSQVVDGYKLNHPYTWMGRNRGLHGPELQEDVETGRWKSQPYEVRECSLSSNRNWFPIADFIKKIEGTSR